MSHQSPYAMHPRPSRVPEHAAAIGGNAALRGRARRALKLIAISTAWVTGLFMVIAAVTVVAVATAPIARNTGTAVAQQARARQPAIPAADRAGSEPGGAGGSLAGPRPARRGPAASSPAARGSQPGPGSASGVPRVRASAPARILDTYIGLGSANTSQFTIGGTGTWKLAWSYDCTGAGTPGTFAVSQHGPGRGGHGYVHRSGMAGQGVSWAHHDAGLHFLEIRTRCRWRLTVASR